MYTRLNSNRLPLVVIKTENEYIISSDKSGVLVKGTLDGGYLSTLPIRLERHAIHVMTNPALGGGLTAYTPDDGEFVAKVRVSKAKEEILDTLDWHFRLAIVRIDLPALD